MTFKITKSKVISALIAVVFVLTAVFAVSFSHSVFAEDEDDGGEAPLEPGVYWEYTADDVEQAEPDQIAWHEVKNGDYPFTYSAADYSNKIRAKIVTQSGDLLKTEYVVYKANASEGMYLSFSGRFNNDDVNTLVNATTYTATVNNVPEDYGLTEEQTTLSFSIAKLDVSSDDFADYSGVGDVNRLWVMQLSGGTAGLRDQTAYYDPNAEFSEEFGAKVTIGAYYNAYVRYTGKAQTIVVNDDYMLKGVRFGAFGLSVSYDDTNTATGLADKVNEITTTATITLNDNFLTVNGQNHIDIRKIWYIVTINNELRMWDGSDSVEVSSWMYGDDITSLKPLRPEHGDNAVFALSKDGVDIPGGRFAAKYTGDSVAASTVKYYETKREDGVYVIDETKPLDGDYYTDLLAPLTVGAYTLKVDVPAYTSTSGHKHWWGGDEDTTTDIVFYPISRTFNFAVSCYELTHDNVSLSTDNLETDLIITVLANSVLYNGLDSNVPDVIVTFRGELLEEDVDYKIESPNVNVGLASLIISGRGTFMGSVQFDDVYDILQSFNSWVEVPGIMLWTYGSYNREMNLISAIPAFLDNKNDLWFKITTDKIGDKPVSDTLREFRLSNGLVSDEVAAELSVLPVGTYYLFGTVNESTNYKRLAPRGVAFNVFKGVNSWATAPTISSWKEGSFKDENLPTARAMFGNDTLVLVVRDSNGKEVYNSESGLNILKSAEAGVYTLTATVKGTSDYSGLDFSSTFIVFEKPGMPVWVTVVIVLGAILLVAIILLILWKAGVFSILTEKLLVQLRTQATVDATIAAVRANKRNEEAKQHAEEVAKKEQEEAKKKERSEARKKQAAARKAEQAAAAATEQPEVTEEPAAEQPEAPAEEAHQPETPVEETPEVTEAPAEEKPKKAAAKKPAAKKPAAKKPKQSATDNTDAEDK